MASMSPPGAEEVRRLIGTAHVMLVLAGAGFLAWNLGEALAAARVIGGIGYLVSGIGFGLFLVGAILFLGMAMQGLKREMFDFRTDPRFKRARAIALYPAIAAGALAALGFAYAGNGDALGMNLIRVTLGAGLGVFLIVWGLAGPKQKA
jgi:hypothetical protein